MPQGSSEEIIIYVTFTPNFLLAIGLELHRQQNARLRKGRFEKQPQSYRLKGVHTGNENEAVDNQKYGSQWIP